MENKPASSFVVSLGKALNGTPHLYVKDRQSRHQGDWPLPSDCRCPVQNIAIQFAFSWMEDKHGQKNGMTKFFAASDSSCHIALLCLTSILCKSGFAALSKTIMGSQIRKFAL